MDIPYYPAKCLKCGQTLSAHGAACEACGYDPLKSDEKDTEGEPLQNLIEAWEGPHTSVWLTPTLLGLNLAVFIGMAATGVDILSPDVQSLSGWGANVGQLTVSGQWWRLLTSMFLHVGIVHLLFNMWVLWGIGGVVERLLGNVGFAVVYLLGGLYGSFASLAWDPDVVSAGASGAIFGLYGALLGFLLRDRHSIAKDVQRQTAKSALIFLGYNLLFGMAHRGVDVAAHLGGLLGGFLCGYFLALPPAAGATLRRARTNFLVLAGGLTGLIILAIALPKERGVSGEFTQAKQIEEHALGKFDEAAAKVRSGALTYAGFADAIEREVIPELRQFRSRLVNLENNPRARTESIKALERYSDDREKVFHQIAQALRTGNEEEAGKAMNQLAAASNRLRTEMGNAR